jgi:hypothetical protein
VLAALEGNGVCCGTEAELSAAVASLLSRAGIEFEAEVRIDARSRLDFLVGRVAIELKIRGGLSALIRQLDRYAQSDRIDAIAVVTTSRRLGGVPSELRGKPITVICMGVL